MRVVLDTNVIVSAWEFSGVERALFDAAIDGRYELVVPEVVVRELRDVMPRKFAWSNEQVEADVAGLVNLGELVSTITPLNVIDGQDADNQILSCAVEQAADYLVTGDRKHLLPLGEFEGVRILRAPDFLAVLDAAD